MVSCAKMAVPVEMPFGLWAQIGLRNCVRWGEEKGWPVVKYSDCLS